MITNTQTFLKEVKTVEKENPLAVNEFVEDEIIETLNSKYTLDEEELQIKVDEILNSIYKSGLEKTIIKYFF